MKDTDAGSFCFLHNRMAVGLTSEWGEPFKVHCLFASPVNVPRNKLSDMVSAALAARVKGNCSLEFEDGANTRFWERVNDTRQRFPRDWRTKQAPPKPFESGPGVLPGMEECARKNRVVKRVMK